ncbi:hypothetical protein [Cronobacter dublinensis]|uniref:hypothetical protein n=1 Tax=Cronobacter dublinensis TaxID=413497 RepID=UPI001ED96015|nr:hypothetical protein [Cronobacter dublinensis]NCH06889.1 hypothetical protein [Cronobacter dublinensis]
MSEISKERVEALASNILECHDVKPSEVKALAALALMALRKRAEPVAWIAAYHGEVYDDITARTRSAAQEYADKYGWEPALTEITPLYAAPPAPVVTAETFEEWSRRCEIQLTLCSPEFREVAEITWNACCAAMIAAPSKEG